MMAMVAGRLKHPLGDLFGLTNFGVNPRPRAGCVLGTKACAREQDEFVYCSKAKRCLLRLRETVLRRVCRGLQAGTGDAHHLHIAQEGRVFLEVETARR